MQHASALAEAGSLLVALQDHCPWHGSPSVLPFS